MKEWCRENPFLTFFIIVMVLDTIVAVAKAFGHG